MAGTSGSPKLAQSGKPMLLSNNRLKSWVNKFNASDKEHYKNTYPNSKAYEFLKNNVPLLECPDKEIEKIYYFRWWTYRKHIRQTQDGYVVTEFLPRVGWASKHNVISAPASHHFLEGRWLHQSQIMRDYMNFFLTNKDSGAHRYSFWPSDSISGLTDVHPDDAWLGQMLPALENHYKGWAAKRIAPDELYARIDLYDGMEWNAGGRAVTGGKEFIMMVKSVRPSFNSYMYADAAALSRIAEALGRKETADHYGKEAALLKQLVQTRLWNKKLKFFTLLPADYKSDTRPADVREQIGFIPWIFNLPDKGRGYEVAWKQLMDPKGFYAPFGPTTCEQRHPYFRVEYKTGVHCQWNGPSWPFATSQTLTALANVLNNYEQDVVSKKDYLETIKIYTGSHAFREIPPESDKGRKAIVKEDLPWIDENIDPYTGNWLTRYRLNKGEERGKDYNHSTYCDLIISGLIGLRPQRGNTVVVNPLVPQNTWDWFCLDNILYHGHILTILWDKNGSKYDKGVGLMVFADGKKIASSRTLARVSGELK